MRAVGGCWCRLDGVPTRVSRYRVSVSRVTQGNTAPKYLHGTSHHRDKLSCSPVSSAHLYVDLLAASVGDNESSVAGVAGCRGRCGVTRPGRRGAEWSDGHKQSQDTRPVPTISTHREHTATPAPAPPR